MDLSLIDLTSAPTEAAPDPHAADGLALAARGDWHAAAESFATALAAVDGSGDDVQRAVALTNLGQARAHLGALDDAVRLLARSVDARDRLVDAGVVGASVAMRGLVDLAAVCAAAGDAAAARDALRRARALSDGSDAPLMYVVAQGLALLDAGPPPAASVDDEPVASEVPAFSDLGLVALDDDAWTAEPPTLEWIAEPEPLDAAPSFDFVVIDEPYDATTVIAAGGFDVADDALLGEASTALPWILDDPAEEDRPSVASVVSNPVMSAAPIPAAPPPDDAYDRAMAPSPAATPAMGTRTAPGPNEARWWQRLGRRGRA